MYAQPLSLTQKSMSAVMPAGALEKADDEKFLCVAAVVGARDSNMPAFFSGLLGLCHPSSRAASATKAKRQMVAAVRMNFVAIPLHEALIARIFVLFQIVVSGHVRRDLTGFTMET